MATMDVTQGARSGPIDMRPERAFRIPDKRRWGAAQRRALFRAAMFILLAEVIGLALIFAIGGTVATAVGLSLIVPGGGLLYSAWPILFVVTWAGMFVGWNLWIGFGSFFHVLVAYTVPILVTALLAEGPRLGVAEGTTWDWAVPVLLFAAALYAVRHLIRAEVGHRRSLRQREERNALLDQVAPEAKANLVASFAPRAHRRQERPINDADAALAKWLLKLSMQPIDSFDGWDWKGQAWQAYNLRYQINGVGEALALFEANYVPAYPSLYEQAQRNVIEKFTNRQVWGYWFGENFFGNLKLNPDPIAGGTWDNIMYGGFFGLHLAHYEAVTHDHRYDQPGAFRFVWRDGRVFSYSYRDIIEYNANAHMNSHFTLYPCEPNQIYMFCNQLGAAGVQAYDNLHGTDYWARVKDRWTKALDEEFMLPNGDFPGIRNTRLGMNIGAMGMSDGTVNPNEGSGNGAIVARGRTMDPELATRLFLQANMQQGWDKMPIEDDVLRLPPSPPPLERKGLLDAHYWRKRLKTPKDLIAGNWVDAVTGSGWPAPGAFSSSPHHSANRVGMYTGIAATARTWGNDKLAEAAIRGVDEECFLGMEAERPFFDRVGGLGSGLTALCRARWSAPYDEEDVRLARIPKYEGPLLASAPYPDVLVTRAKGSDGVLELTMEPTSASGRFPLTFERLLPNRAYFIEGDGATFTTDQNGLGEASVSLSQRVFLTVRPA